MSPAALYGRRMPRESNGHQYLGEDGSVIVDSSGSPLNVDGWHNVLTGLGNQLRDKRLAAVFKASGLLQKEQLDNLYAGDWLIARACDRPAADQVRRWVDVKVDGQKGADEDIAEELKRLEIKRKLEDAIVWSRLHGGGVIVLGIDDGLDPWEPVNENRIRGVTWANVVDRWEIIPQSYYARQDADRYGEPETYQLTTTVVGSDGSTLGGLMVHESRTLRVDGTRTPLRVRRENQGWNLGVAQRIHDAVRDFHTAHDGAAHLTTDFSQMVFKMKGLSRMLAEDREDLVRKRMLTMDLMRSLVRMVPLDEDESMERVTTQVAGIADLLDRLRDVVCGATDLPEKILFGKATAGLGDQGQSDLEQYYNQIEGEQERNVVSPLTRLVRYLYRAQPGNPPSKWHVEPRSLWSMSDEEVSKVRNQDAETDRINIESGIYTPEEARRSRYGGDGYGREIVIEGDDDELDDIRSADPSDPSVSGTQVVEQVTPQGITAATQILEKVVSGKLTVASARPLLRAALKLEDSDIEEMLEGVEEERAAREQRAQELLERTGNGGGGTSTPPTASGQQPDPNAPPED